MADIFLSYAREDTPVARLLAASLASQGWSVFWDRQIAVGATWDRIIEAELARAGCVVVLWSSVSVDSDWVRLEAAEAVARGVLVPASLDGTQPPLRFRQFQTADLSGWGGDAAHPGLVSLYSAVRAIKMQPDGAATPENGIRALKDGAFRLEVNLIGVRFLGGRDLEIRKPGVLKSHLLTVIDHTKVLLDGGQLSSLREENSGVAITANWFSGTSAVRVFDEDHELTIRLLEGFLLSRIHGLQISIDGRLLYEERRRQ